MPAELPAGNGAPETNAANNTGPTEAQRPEDGPARNASHSDAGGGQRPATEARAAKSLMDHLGIPDDIQTQISPHTKDEAPESQRPEARGQRPEARGQRPGEEEQGPASVEGEAADVTSGEGDGDEHGEEEGEEEEPSAELPKDVRKLQKRVQRLTKKLREEERTRQAYEAKRQQIAQAQQQAANAAPITQGNLGAVTTEAQLDAAVTYHDAVVDLAERNPDGVQVGEGDKAKFIPPEELAALKRTSEKFLRGAEPRRREIREFNAARQSNDAAAQKEWPELFKPDSPEYQTGVWLVNRYPFIRQMPDANYAIGLLVEGMKALNARQKNGEHLTPNAQRLTPNAQRPTPNGENGKRAIDERVFGPRSPLAPHTASPPSREVQPSGRKKIDKAAADLLADPDGSAESLARALQAIDDARPSGATTSRGPVTV